jgi:hypothetical protein
MDRITKSSFQSDRHINYERFPAFCICIVLVPSRENCPGRFVNYSSTHVAELIGRSEYSQDIFVRFRAIQQPFNFRHFGCAGCREARAAPGLRQTSAAPETVPHQGSGPVADQMVFVHLFIKFDREMWITNPPFRPAAIANPLFVTHGAIVLVHSGVDTFLRSAKVRLPVPSHCLCASWRLCGFA